MSDLFVRVVSWTLDFQILATILMGSTCLFNLILRQPARRISLSWFAVIGILMLAIGLLVPPDERIKIGSMAVISSPGNSTHDGEVVSELWSVGKPAKDDPTSLPMKMPIRPSGEFTPHSDSVFQVDASYGVAIYYVYLIVGILVAAWQLLGYLVAKRIVVLSRRPHRSLVREFRRIQPGSRIRLRITDQLDQPVAVGVFKPMVLLPANFARTASRQELQAAMIHEVTHVKRGDLWMIALFRFLSFFLLLNPVFWWLRRQVVWNQELLADAAASRRWEPISYAEMLVTWSRRRCHRLRFGGAMASLLRPSMLPGRVSRLLDESRSLDLQVPRCWRPIMLFAVISCVVMLSQFCFCGVRIQKLLAHDLNRALENRVHLRNHDETHHVVFASDVTMQLVGLRQHPCGGTARWNPDGSLPDGGFDCGAELQHGTPVEMVLRVENPRGVPIQWNVDPSNVQRLADYQSLHGGSDSHDFYAISIPVSDATGDFRLSFTLGDWQTRFQSSRPLDHYVLSPCDDVEGETLISIQHPHSANEDLRLLAVDTHGCSHLPNSMAPESGEISARFDDLALSHVQEFCLQSRPKLWIEFNNVSLRPGQVTDFEVLACGNEQNRRKVKL